MKATPIFLAALAALSACATGVRAGGETAIPFVSSDGITDFRAAGDDALYIKAIGGDWYYVRTSGPCNRLIDATSLGFVTTGGDQLDRFGAIVAQGVRCPVASVVRSPGPPPKATS